MAEAAMVIILEVDMVRNFKSSTMKNIQNFIISTGGYGSQYGGGYGSQYGQGYGSQYGQGYGSQYGGGYGGKNLKVFCSKEFMKSTSRFGGFSDL